MRLAALLLFTSLAFAEPPADVRDFFRTAAEALVNDDASAFLAKFDRSLPGYDTLRGHVQGLLAGHDVGSSIEIVNHEGDNQRRTLELDWVLVTTEKAANHSNGITRRRIVKCRIERRGKQWKITAFEPVEFFKY
ncbi:MAG: hypothetical protein EXQ47_02235 [Bryobacterales bacterium]|nr:hypothetical protein [Bryobacterales bacterium]